MFCPKCGNKLQDNAKFCSSCGNQISTENISKPAEPKVDRQAVWSESFNSSPPAQTPPPYRPPVAPQQPKKKRLQWWHILLIALGALIILISVIVGISSSSDSGGQTSTGGIFYSNSKCPSKERIKSDIATIDDVVNDNDNSWSIVDIEEVLAQELEKAYETKVKIKLKNDIYKEAYKTIELKYDYYDKGGWVLNKYEKLSSVFDAVASQGVSESKAFAFITDKYSGEIRLDARDTELELKFDYLSYLVETPGKLWNEQKRVVLKYKINEDSGLWGYPTVEEISTERQFNKVSGWFYTEIGGGRWDDYNDKECYRIDSFDGETAVITVVDIAINGKEVQGYNTNLMPSNTIVSDSYVCYRLECKSQFNDEMDWYSLKSTNSGGAVVIKLERDGLILDLSDDPEMSYEENLSDCVDIPSSVNQWLNN